MLLAVAAWAPGRAAAHQNGFATEGCSGCHASGTMPTAAIALSSDTISPGQMITLTVTITAPTIVVGGLFLEATKGTLTALSGEGTKLLGGGVTHSTPKRAAGGTVSFRVGWTAPATPGGVDFNAFVVAANGDGSSRGDSSSSAFYTVTYGCSGMTYYRDFDGDGYGAKANGYTHDCTKPPLYSLMDGDCDDNDERVHPGATEVCNKRDDNCDGQIDENLPIMTYYTDADGDGHGAVDGKSVMGCAPPKGYGVGNDDCNDADPEVYAGAQELCNYRDDNCNGQIDENAREACGVGWCRRLGSGCGSNDCVPGKPRAEMCNAFDDDCDGVNDNGANLCGAGMACVSGYCIGPDGGVGPDGAPLVYPTYSDPNAGCAVGARPTPQGAGAVAALLLLACLLGWRRRRE